MLRIPESFLSAETWVMLNPRGAYPHLAKMPATGGRWLILKRPSLVALVFGCTISLLTSGRLTLRLIGPAMIYWSFVPLLEIASLAAVCGRQRRVRSLAQTIDLFFMGQAPWSLWLIGFAAIWAFVPAIQVFAWSAGHWIWYGSALLVMAWSGYIDFCFFRCALRRTPIEAARDLVLQRVLCWIPALLCFLGSSAWTVIAPRAGW